MGAATLPDHVQGTTFLLAQTVVGRSQARADPEINPRQHVQPRAFIGEPIHQAPDALAGVRCGPGGSHPQRTWKPIAQHHQSLGIGPFGDNPLPPDQGLEQIEGFSLRERGQGVVPGVRKRGDWPPRRHDHR